MRDPKPWRHASGVRTASPDQTAAPEGGYTFAPRHGYSDHADRYRSQRWHSIGACALCDDRADLDGSDAPVEGDTK